MPSYTLEKDINCEIKHIYFLQHPDIQQFTEYNRSFHIPRLIIISLEFFLNIRTVFNIFHNFAVVHLKITLLFTGFVAKAQIRLYLIEKNKNNIITGSQLRDPNL